MTDDEKEAVWEEIEKVAFVAISKVAKLLDKLDDIDKIAIYANLEEIASDGISKINEAKKLH